VGTTRSRPLAGKEQRRSRAEAGQEQGRSRVRVEQSRTEQSRKRAGAEQDFGRSLVRSFEGARQEYSRSRVDVNETCSLSILICRSSQTKNSPILVPKPNLIKIEKKKQKLKRFAIGRLW